MGALSATFNPKYREGFQPLVPGFHFARFNEIGEWRSRLGPDTAAVILEAVQGEAGVYVSARQFMEDIQQLCREKGVLLIIDEVQTGFGRTGRLFACEHYDLQPDILCLSKALGGGFPIGAVLCGSKIRLQPGKHGTTFGGNPLACAAANAAIDIVLRDRLPETAGKKGKYFFDRFSRNMPATVKEFRYLGLMIGIELNTKVEPVVEKMQNRGILVLRSGSHILRLLPPLTISYKHLDIVSETLREILQDITPAEK
jgi:acetylornithine/LysW-gamma-L-lysine aminotransferase